MPKLCRLRRCRPAQTLPARDARGGFEVRDAAMARRRVLGASDGLRHVAALHSALWTEALCSQNRTSPRGYASCACTTTLGMASTRPSTAF